MPPVPAVPASASTASSNTATAVAHPNIALCKYWGKRDRVLNLPSTPSLSLTLAPFSTRTTVVWGAETDAVSYNGQPSNGVEAQKILRFLDRFGPRPPCSVTTINDFPTAAGLASSASGFAALALAANAASGTYLPLGALSAVARQGSGSATRSLHGGWVEWVMGTRPDGSDSHGVPVAPAEHWDVVMVVVIVQAGPKAIGSTEGMNHTVATSPYYPAWVEQAPAEHQRARQALLARDLQALGEVMERSAMRMHASMLAAAPAVMYWTPATIAALQVVHAARKAGVGAWATMDAGPNVKVLCAGKDAESLVAKLTEQGLGAKVLVPGGPARVSIA